MLGILVPNVTTLVTYEDALDATQSSLRERFVFHFEETTNLACLDQTLPRAALGEFAVCGNLLFDVKNLVQFDFTVHEKFFTAFQKQYPKLAGELYQHNEAFKTLQKNLLAVSNKGQTPREVIKEFIQQLVLGGETLTRGVLANPRANGGD